MLTFITETDLISSGLAGFYGARQPDTPKLRVWEVPGAAHVDNYMFFIGGADDGHAPVDKIAALWRPNDQLFGRLPNFGRLVRGLGATVGGAGDHPDREEDGEEPASAHGGIP